MHDQEGACSSFLDMAHSLLQRAPLFTAKRGALYSLPHPGGRQGSHVMCMIIGPHEVQKTANIQIGPASGGDLHPWKSSGQHPTPIRPGVKILKHTALTRRGLVSGPH